MDTPRRHREQLAADTELSERTVRRKLIEAERLGLIKRLGPEVRALSRTREPDQEEPERACER